MLNSIFTRALNTSIESALTDSVHYNNQTWRNISRQWTTDNRRLSDDQVSYYFRCTRGEFFSMNAEETKELRRMADAMSSISNNYTSLALYLWLVKHSKLDLFFNNLKEKLNANTQTA